MAAVVFKEADTDSEIQQVHRLNHLTFAEELGQHPATPEGFLVDRFHARNRYMVAVENGKVVGMISVHDQPPFSIQKRMPGGLDPLERFARPCEVRLLAIERGARRGMILAGLFWRVYDYAKKSLHSHMLISGVQERLAMYKALGFEELGPAQAEGASSFVPMALDLRRESARLRKRASLYSSWWQRRVASAPISLLPGPVAISPEVRAAFQQTVLSHREESFLQTHTRVRAHLGQLSAGMNAVIVTGSGTFANDMVAAALRAAFGEVRGLVLANGEFGDRLVAQARRAGLRFESLIWQWGSAWEFGAIEKRLRGGAAWVWGVHLETSTSELNDLRHLSDLCKQNGARLAADCVSSLGAVAIDDLDLMFASGVSGKAIGAYPGLAFVFANREPVENLCFDHVPASLDLRAAIRSSGPLFTMPSPQLLALEKALEAHYATPESSANRFRHYASLGRWMRGELRRSGLSPLVSEAVSAPTIATFTLPDARCAERCREAGYQIAHESGYLKERSWGQISVMGDLDKRRIAPVFAALRVESGTS